MVLEESGECKLENLNAANESSETESNAFALSNSHADNTAGRITEMTTLTFV
jgi:hypothetical protein